MKPETLTIILPLPPQCLSPNWVSGSFGGRMARASATKKYRRQAKEASEAEGIESGPWQKIEMKAHFYHKQKRRRDGVNHNAMLKSAQDGIVDSGVAVDDDSLHWSTLEPEFSIDKQLSRVEITITRIL